MKILCVSHSDRPFVEARSSLGYLNNRFSADRFETLPPFDTLPSISDSVPFTGSLSFWEMTETPGEVSARLCAKYNPDYKVQFASFVGDRLIVLGSDRLEILDSGFNVIQTIRDPWLIGGHTVFPAGADDLWVTSAPANAVLRVSLREGRVVERRRLPAVYGTGYDLKDTDDLSAHFIPTDLQPTHINCAVPLLPEDPASAVTAKDRPDDLLVTLWIPGAIGILGGDGHYREVLSGMRGLHGARPVPGSNLISFADSAAGLICFIDRETGRLAKRFALNSLWLHDAEVVSPGVIAATLSDSNEIALVDSHNGDVLFRTPCDDLGQSTMFVTACTVDGPWLSVFGREETAAPLTPHLQEPTGPNLLAPLISQASGLQTVSDSVKTVFQHSSSTPLLNERILKSEPIRLAPGRYQFECRAECRRGSVLVSLAGISDAAGTCIDRWLAQIPLDSKRNSDVHQFSLTEETCAQLIVLANPLHQAPLSAQITYLSLQHLDGDEARGDEPAAVTASGHQASLGTNLVPFWLNESGWFLFAPRAHLQLKVSSASLLSYEWLYGTREFALPPGTYHLSVSAVCTNGAISVGLINVLHNSWVEQVVLDTTQFTNHCVIETTETLMVRLVVAACNHANPGLVDAIIHDLRLQPQARDKETHGPTGLTAPVPLLEAEANWFPASGSSAFHLPIISARPAVREYLTRSASFTLHPGRYLLHAKADILLGSIAFGVLDTIRNVWITQTTDLAEFTLTAKTRVCIIVSADNMEPQNVAAVLRAIQIRPMSAGVKPLSDLIMINRAADTEEDVIALLPPPPAQPDSETAVIAEAPVDLDTSPAPLPAEPAAEPDTLPPDDSDMPQDDDPAEIPADHAEDAGSGSDPANPAPEDINPPDSPPS